MTEVEKYLKIEQDGYATTKYITTHLDDWVVISSESHATMQFSPKQLEELISFLMPE